MHLGNRVKFHFSWRKKINNRLTGFIPYKIRYIIVKHRKKIFYIHNTVLQDSIRGPCVNRAQPTVRVWRNSVWSINVSRSLMPDGGGHCGASWHQIRGHSFLSRYLTPSDTTHLLYILKDNTL